MEWKLVIAKGEHKGTIIPIRFSPFVIGRDHHCQLRPKSPYVSHRHCLLIRRGKALVLRDCHSTNGTFVNGRRMREVELRPGDRVGVGPLSFVVSLKGPMARNEEHKKSSSRHMPRIASEEAIAALLLEMDKQAAGIEPDANSTSRLSSSFSAAETNTATTHGSGSPGVAQEKASLSPAEVAAAILSKKSFAWLRQKSRNSAGSEESFPN